MKIFAYFLFLLPLTVHAQTQEELQHRQKADSIILFFLGNDIAKRYVSLDPAKSESRSSGSFFFHYDFRHPAFSGETFIITFALDSSGQFIPGKDTHGIIRIVSADSAWTSAQQALTIARDNGKRAKKSSLRLAWDTINISYDAFYKSKDFRDISPGKLVWLIDGEVLFRGDTYSGTFEINVQTGVVSKRFAIPWD